MDSHYEYHQCCKWLVKRALNANIPKYAASDCSFAALPNEILNEKVYLLDKFSSSEQAILVQARYRTDFDIS